MRKNALVALVALTTMMSACGDGIGDVTTGSAPSTTVNTPAATPTPAAAASPTPTPVSGALSCTLARLPNCDANCCREGGTVRWRSQIEAAQASLRTLQPALFHGNGDVRDNIQYMNALTLRLTQMFGLCAEPLGHDEIRVKEDQNFSQHIDVLIADATPWVGGAYTCQPASF